MVKPRSRGPGLQASVTLTSGDMISGNDQTGVWTVPNVICGVRILGLIPLLWAGHQGHRQWLLWIMVALLVSDWIDGKLAVLLEQRTALGARLDSAADALMYIAIGVCFWWLEEDVIRQHLGWLAGVASSWGLSALVGLLRFGRLPSYHTRGAKISWLVAGGIAVYLLNTGDAAPLSWGAALVILANLEGTAIGLLLPDSRTDVPSAFHAWRVRRRRRDQVGR